MPMHTSQNIVKQCWQEENRLQHWIRDRTLSTSYVGRGWFLFFSMEYPDSEYIGFGVQ